MKINELKKRPEILQDEKLKEAFLQFEKLLDELRNRNLPDDLIIEINRNIDEINTSSGRNFRKIFRRNQTRIIRTLEKELKIVPKNYYRKLWTTLGIAVYGIPFGFSFGLSLGNMAFIGLGLPLGLAIGMNVGSGMDRKALREGRQMETEITN